jgi:hypothetical protein
MDDITGMSDTEHERVAQSGERKCAEYNDEILKAVGLEGRIGRLAVYNFVSCKT